MAKTVLICSNVYPPRFIGGAELIAHYHAKALAGRGYNVIVFTGEIDPGRERYSMRQDHYDELVVFRVCLRPDDYQLDAVNFFNARIDAHFAALLDAFSPELVHLHNIAGLSAGVIGEAKDRSVKTILTLHDHWGFCYKNTLIKTGSEICRDYTRCAECLPFIRHADRQIPIRMRQDFLKVQLANVDVFISPSTYLAETYARVGIPIGKIRVIWNGVDVGRFSSVGKEPRSASIRFTFIGHFGFHKGVDIILDALQWIPQLDCIFLNLVGGGELENHLRARVQAARLAAVVKFWGKLDNSRIEEVFRQTDVLILPSIWPENQPVSITEAMAARTPVIASAIGGIPELVVDGHNGYLFQPGSGKDLARKMLEFILNPERLESFGENGFRLILEKSVEHQVDKICSLYD